MLCSETNTPGQGESKSTEEQDHLVRSTKKIKGNQLEVSSSEEASPMEADSTRASQNIAPENTHGNHIHGNPIHGKSSSTRMQ